MEIEYRGKKAINTYYISELRSGKIKTLGEFNKFDICNLGRRVDEKIKKFKIKKYLDDSTFNDGHVFISEVICHFNVVIKIIKFSYIASINSSGESYIINEIQSVCDVCKFCILEDTVKKETPSLFSTLIRKPTKPVDKIDVKQNIDSDKNNIIKIQNESDVKQDVKNDVKQDIKQDIKNDVKQDTNTNIVIENPMSKNDQQDGRFIDIDNFRIDDTHDTQDEVDETNETNDVHVTIKNIGVKKIVVPKLIDHFPINFPIGLNAMSAVIDGKRNEFGEQYPMGSYVMLEMHKIINSIGDEVLVAFTKNRAPSPLYKKMFDYVYYMAMSEGKSIDYDYITNLVKRTNKFMLYAFLKEPKPRDSDSDTSDRHRGDTHDESRDRHRDNHDRHDNRRGGRSRHREKSSLM